MCGIAGLIGTRKIISFNRWVDSLSHRGPDSCDFWQYENTVLVHNRLAILDLSVNGNQPMISHDNRYVIVFNGEIFNFIQLRNELIKIGKKFKTNSDTEVLLEGFIHWGEGVLNKIDGMFAFAIWDIYEKVLFVARDHAGIKPLYYSYSDSNLIFGSEIKSLLDSGVITREIVDKSVVDYLAYSYIPCPNTIYKNINCLPPGEILIFDYKNKSLKTKKWWSLPSNGEYFKYSFDDAIHELRYLISNSVKNRLTSDVPIGLFLSGGLDSSVIALEMSRYSLTKVKSFSIGYEYNDEYDESKYASQVAKYLGMDHKILYPDFNDINLEEHLDIIVNQFDQPYGNPTVLLTSILTKSIKEEMSVAMVGDGGDELFGGYPRYWALQQQEKYGYFIRAFRSIFLSGLSLFSESPDSNHIQRRLRKFLTSSNSNIAISFEESTRLFSHNTLEILLLDKFKNYVYGQNFIADLFNKCNANTLTRACYADQLSFLNNNLLDGADRMSMRNGFELRLPFVNRLLMEFAITLPPEFLIKGRVQKFILKETYKDDLPVNILNRRKRGFNPPVWHWLKNNKEIMTKLTNTKSRLSEYVNIKEVKLLIDRFNLNKEDSSSQIWSLLILDRWFEKIS